MPQITRVDLRTRQERALPYTSPLRARLYREAAPDGFQSQYSAWMLINGTYQHIGYLGQLQGSGAGWYASAARTNADSPTLSAPPLRRRGVRYVSRRAAARDLYDLAVQRSRIQAAQAAAGVGGTTATADTEVPRHTCDHCLGAAADDAVPVVNRRYSENNSSYLCTRCEDQRRRQVVGYHYWNTAARMFGGRNTATDGNVRHGFELEVAYSGGYGTDHSSTVSGLYSRMPSLLMMAERDGSVSNGFEAITAPMTRDYFAEQDWRGMLAYLEGSGYRSHDGGHCGLHIHVGREAFGAEGLEREGAIARMLYIGEQHWDDMLRLSRRTDDSWRDYADSYARRFGAGEADVAGACSWAAQDSRKAKNNGAARMCWLNLQNEHTVEFRLPRGTLKASTFQATFDLLWALVDAAVRTPFAELSAAHSLRSILLPYATDELLAYLDEREVM